MIGIVSHDLRNPLSAIQLSAYVLERAALAGPHRKALERIASSTQRAQRLIEDLLDFTAAKVGRGLSVTRESIDLHRVVAGAAEELRTSFPGREIEVFATGVGACRGDADRLTQAIGNLVGNAMTYGAIDRPIRLTSRIEQESFSSRSATRASRSRPRSWRPVRADDARRRVVNAARSVGLGLFIVREIARAHGGDAGVRSSLEGGTTFFVRCPR
jgi:sigma-B regulation protein RsbU (phosphoserine phosphatase)